MAGRIYLKVPPGSRNRPAIEMTLSRPAESRILQKAVDEYTELLTTENKFVVEDVNSHKSICRRVEQLFIESYTNYGEELRRRFPDSYLIKLIFNAYTTHRNINERDAMQEFAVLKELSLAYSLAKKKSEQVSSRTVHDRSKNPAGPSQQFSQTVNPKHPAHDSHQPASSKDKIFLYDDQPAMIEGRKYYPEYMYQQLENHAKIQERELMDLRNELKQQKQEMDELRNRLSGFASRQLTEGNPDFTDLSDKNRPTVIAEKFHSVYDDEWTSCLESLTHSKKGTISLSEEEAISLLMDIIKRCFLFCTNYTEKQKDMVMDAWNRSLQDPFSQTVDFTKPNSSLEVPEIVMNELKKRRRQNYAECIRNACQNFKEKVLKTDSKLKSKLVPDVEAYADKCVEIIWRMTVQDPPMHLCWPEEKHKFDNELYKEYGKKGKVVKLAVWPAVLLHKQGAIMYKGFAMPM